jgi:hypothetical protein
VQTLLSGKHIKHHRYGFGVVNESDTGWTTIEFETCGTKKLVTGLLVVELVKDLPRKLRRLWNSKNFLVRTDSSSEFHPGMK